MSNNKETLQKTVKGAGKIVGEFKKFIMRGNVLDMAVGLIVGSAFTGIVNSLVSDMFMPLLGMITGRIDFSELKIILQAAVMEEGVEVTPEVSIRYGMFIQNIINFLLIALSVFLLIKAINTLREKMERKKKEEEAAEPPAPPAPDPQVILLEEIRDLLKEKQDGAVSVITETEGKK